MDDSMHLAIEDARKIFKIALNKAISQTKLPAFLIEGVVLGILSDIREQKVAELCAELNLKDGESNE